MNTPLSPDVQKAFELAKAARQRAHAPYSRYLVGAALKVRGSDQYFSGCNVENSSYGATNCAERSAIFSMVSQAGAHTLEFMVLVTDNQVAVSPCGICRQVVSEFADENTVVYLANLQGIQKSLKLDELLPERFTKSSLPPN